MGEKGFSDLKFRTFIGHFQSVGAASTAVKGLSSLVYIWKAVAASTAVKGLSSLVYIWKAVAASTAVKGLSSLVYIWKAVASACVQVAGRRSENWVKGHIKNKKS